MFKVFIASSHTSDRGNIFTNLSEPGYLSRLPETKAYAAIIDSYRLRVDDEYKFQGEAGGLYAGESPLSGFQEYLAKAEECGDVLPSWWNSAKRLACEKQSMQTSQWSCLQTAVEKSDVMEHYKDRWMPMRLRMLAERVTGSHVGGL